jgi:hypothetical protein
MVPPWNTLKKNLQPKVGAISRGSTRHRSRDRRSVSPRPHLGRLGNGWRSGAGFGEQIAAIFADLALLRAGLDLQHFITKSVTCWVLSMRGYQCQLRPQ